MKRILYLFVFFVCMNFCNSHVMEWKRLRSAPDPIEPSPRAMGTWVYDPETELSYYGFGLKEVYFGTNDTYYNDMWEYDVNSKKWTELETFGDIPEPRAYHCATIFNGVYYVWGGTMSVHNTPYPNYVFYGDLYALNLTSFEWSMIDLSWQPQAPTSRGGCTCVRKDNIWYLVGGGNLSGQKNDVYSLDFNTFQWTRLIENSYVTGPQGRANGAIGMRGNDIYWLVGESATSATTAVQHNDVWKFSLVSLDWTKVEEKRLWIEHLADVAFTSDDENIYIQGGDRPTTEKCCMAPTTETSDTLYIFDMKKEKFYKFEQKDYGIPSTKRSSMILVDSKFRHKSLLNRGGYEFSTFDQVGTKYNYGTWEMMLNRK